MKLSGKTALVTGAAKRVGKEIALALAGNGAHILLHYNTSKEEAEKTAAEIKSKKVNCTLVQADLAKESDLHKMIHGVLDQSQSMDILVNSASLFYKTPLEHLQNTDWDKLMATNLKAPFILSKAFGQHMAQRNGGKIINIADWSGFRPYKNYLPYCVSKGGLITLTKALARDLAPKVQANAVAPGPVLLPEDMPEEERKKAIEKTVLGREGDPKDVANAVVFLCENDFINGTVLPVDGGRSIN